MQQIIELLASDTGIAFDEANYIFIAITNQLVNKIPALQQVIEDVFANADPEKLREHINKLVVLLQQQGIDKFKILWLRIEGANVPAIFLLRWCIACSIEITHDRICDF